MVAQEYETDVPKSYVINGNSVLLKCVIPSITADFVLVESWSDNTNNEFFSSVNYGNLHLKFYGFSKVVIAQAVKQSVNKDTS